MAVGNGTIGQVGDFVHIDRSAFVEGAGGLLQQVVTVAKAVGFTLEVDDAGVVAPGEVGGVHNHALVGPRPCGAVAHGVAYAFRAAGGRVRQVVMAVLFPYPGTFLVVFGLGWFLDHVTGGGNHVFVQLDVVQVGVAPVQIGLTVVVDERGGVDIVPNVVGVNQPLAQGVFEGPVRAVGHQYAEAATVHGAIQVKFTVAFDALNSPGAVVLPGPFEVFQRGHGTVLRPVDHVGRGV